MSARFIRKLTFTAIVSAALVSPAYAITLDQFHGWLSSSWGETDANGANDENEGCKSTHKLAPEYAGKFKGSGIYGKYLDGSLAFGKVDSGFSVASGYFTPEEINQLDYMERSSKTRVAKLSTAVVTGPKGDFQLRLESTIPGLARPRTIIPITAHSFKLIPPENTEGGFGGARTYYFKRCGMP